MGRRSKIRPTVAGKARNTTPRSVEASERRIAPICPRATRLENVGSAAMAMAWAITICGISMIANPSVRPVRLPSTIVEARMILTKKLS